MESLLSYRMHHCCDFLFKKHLFITKKKKKKIYVKETKNKNINLHFTSFRTNIFLQKIAHSNNKYQKLNNLLKLQYFDAVFVY